MKTLQIELHLLQNFPPSCLNNDDTNLPWTCEFGGVTRARISSQCWKRAIRESFPKVGLERAGSRSKRLKSDIDAAYQVAHAISTHAVRPEQEHVVAVDARKERAPVDRSGAFGIVGYPSACYYRYTLIDVAQLTRKLRGEFEAALGSLEVILKAFIDTVPGAKQNSCAYGSPPFFVFSVVRSDGTPCSLVNAFAPPVYLQETDLLTASATALAEHADRVHRCYDLYQDAECFYFQTIQAELKGLPGESVDTMKDLLARTVNTARAFAKT